MRHSRTLDAKINLVNIISEKFCEIYEMQKATITITATSLGMKYRSTKRFNGLKCDKNQKASGVINQKKRT